MGTFCLNVYEDCRIQSYWWMSRFRKYSIAGWLMTQTASCQTCKIEQKIKNKISVAKSLVNTWTNERSFSQSQWRRREEKRSCVFNSCMFMKKRLNLIARGEFKRKKCEEIFLILMQGWLYLYLIPNSISGDCSSIILTLEQLAAYEQWGGKKMHNYDKQQAK